MILLVTSKTDKMKRIFQPIFSETAQMLCHALEFA
jgi:hypothetical protein